AILCRLLVRLASCSAQSQSQSPLRRSGSTRRWTTLRLRTCLRQALGFGYTIQLVSYLQWARSSRCHLFALHRRFSASISSCVECLSSDFVVVLLLLFF